MTSGAGGRYVLMVDDNPDDHEAWKRALATLPGAPRMAFLQSSDQALTHLQQGLAHGALPSLLLLDLHLPGAGGKEVLAFAKEDERLRRIPVVMLSSSRLGSDVESCYLMGANSYVPKPQTPGQLREVAASLLAYWFGVVLLAEDER